MRIIHIHILAFFFLSAHVAYAQENRQKNERDSTGQWEIGLDLLWLINKNQLPATSLFARYNYVNKHLQKRAWRFRLGIDIRTTDSSQIAAPFDDEIDVVSPYVSIGYEWQKDLTAKASFFYGADISAQYSRFKSGIIANNIFRSFFVQTTDNIWRIGAAPFIGFKYRPVKWLAISTESTIGLIYRIRRQRVNYKDLNFNDFDGPLQGKIDVNEFRISSLPITVVNLSFYLNNF